MPKVCVICFHCDGRTNWYYTAPSEVANLYPLMEHLVAIASATNFVGPEFIKDKDLVETYKHLAVDVGTELGDGNLFLEAFPMISRLRMWYFGKYGHAVDKHRKRILHAIKPVIDARLVAAENGKENPASRQLVCR